jgi:hypothetical protein
VSIAVQDPTGETARQECDSPNLHKLGYVSRQHQMFSPAAGAYAARRVIRRCLAEFGWRMPVKLSLQTPLLRNELAAIKTCELCSSGTMPHSSTAEYSVVTRKIAGSNPAGAASRLSEGGYELLLNSRA